jgi:hypothetical protein
LDHRRSDRLPRGHAVDEALLALRILVFAVAVPWLLRLKLPRLRSLLEPRHAPALSDPAEVQRIVRYVDAVIRLASPLVRRGCLTRGVTLYYFLRRAGVPVSLRFGLGRVNEQDTGHCWLVKDGQPFLEVRDPRPFFAAIYSIPEGVEP